MTSLKTALTALAMLALSTSAHAQTYVPGTATPETAFAPAAAREVWIATVHLDGITGTTASAEHPAEPFPTTALPPGGGLLLRQPDAQGDWRMRAFLFQPAQVIAQEGQKLVLHFVGVQGPSHRIAIEGHGEPFTITRGAVHTIELTPAAPGTIRFASLDRLPSMQGEIVVLPRAR